MDEVEDRSDLFVRISIRIFRRILYTPHSNLFIYSIINFISRWDRKPKAFLRFENPKKQWTVIEICFRFKITKHDINLIKFNYYRSQIKS